MIKQNIDALKLIKSFHSISSEAGERFSLLDAICFLYINEHDDCGQRDICEHLFDDRSIGKSSLDRPLKRLFKNQYIDRKENYSASTKNGESRVFFSVSKKGEKLIKKCNFNN